MSILFFNSGIVVDMHAITWVAENKDKVINQIEVVDVKTITWEYDNGIRIIVKSYQLRFISPID